ncbi:MAG: right-handed parallel beta-helix repeat-containing protein [Myxococcales bacterium]
MRWSLLLALVAACDPTPPRFSFLGVSCSTASDCPSGLVCAKGSCQMTAATSGGSGGRSGVSSGGSSGGGSSTSACPANASGVFAVDPAAGSAAGTGLLEPPGCRFATLGAALAAAQPGDEVRAVGFDGGAVIFASESFPLVVGAGVALDTDVEAEGDGGSAAAYRIVFGAVSAAMVDLAPGASLAGFAIENVTGSAGADALVCSTGSVTVRDCLLEGPAQGNGTGCGLRVTGSCAAELTGTRIENFSGAGARVEGDGGASLAVDGGTFEDNGLANSPVCEGDGIFVAAGTLALANTSFAGNTDYGLGVEQGAVTGAELTFAGPASPGSVPGAFGLGLGNIPALGAGPCLPAATANVTLTDVSITGVAADGIHVNGGSLTLLGTVEVEGNGGQGIDMQSGSLYLENPTIRGNGESGLRNNATGASGSVTVDGGSIGPDDQVDGTWSEVIINWGTNLTLLGTKVQGDPGGPGVKLLGSGLYQLAGCDISGNLVGLDLEWTSGPGPTTATFMGNSIHGNRGDQVTVKRGNWDLSAPACDGGQNAIYCYSDGGYGVNVFGGSVIANDVAWQDAVPDAGIDYNGAVTTAGGVCPAINLCP